MFALRLFLLLLLAPPLVRGAATDSPRDVSATLEMVRAKHGLPGCAVAVAEKGKLTATGAAGVLRVGKTALVDTDDLWPIASCTKSMTATLVGMVVDTGKLRWDMPVPEALPGFACNRAWRKVTVWDVVTHRSGLGPLWYPENSQIISVLSPEQQREAYVRSIVAREPAGPPGKSAYSNAGYAMLGVMVERALGEPYESALKKRIFAPLALDSAGFGPVSGGLSELSGHQRDGDRIVPKNAPTGATSSVMTPAAGVQVSITDFARYAAWVSSNEPKLLAAETAAKLGTPPQDDKYAGGVWKTVMPGIGGEALCHTGTIGGFFCVMYTSGGRACVAAINLEGFGWEWIGDEIVAEVLKLDAGK